MRSASSRALLALIVSLLASQAAHARGGGQYAPVAEMGVNFHAGETGKSLTGAFGYFLTFRAEDRKGFFRPTIAAELQSAVGKASVGTSKPNFTMYGFSFMPGCHLFGFPVARFLPFVGANAILGWNFLSLKGQPASVEPYTQGISYGYEVSAGVDIRPGSSEGYALRIRSGYWWAQAGLAEISGFQLHGFRITMGMVW